MTNCLFLFTVVAVCAFVSATALRVTINGKDAGMSRCNSDIHQPIKLPVWPVWSGVVAQCFDWIKAPQISESIVSNIGGRVVPITLSNLDVSPFLLLAHHCHSFTPLDPIRALTKLVLPEGFPAHPHSGFDTVTYCIEGGLRHRDSEGIRMSYADGDVQWMRAGRGVIHEEMWDLRESDWVHKKIEIFQLWVNLPSKKKSLPPSLHVLKNNDIPNIDCGNGVSVKVICGSLVDAESSIKNMDSLTGPGSLKIPDSVTDGPGSVVSESPVSILHLSMQGPSSSTIINTEAGCTTTVYVRRGSMILHNGEKVEIRPGDCVIFRPPDSSSVRSISSPNSSSSSSSSSSGSGTSSSSNSAQQSVTLTTGMAGLDALVLTGKPLNERVIFQGPLVLADEDSFRKSAEGFNSINRSGYWDHTISDDEWAKHVETLDLQNVISAANANYEYKKVSNRE